MNHYKSPLLPIDGAGKGFLQFSASVWKLISVTGIATLCGCAGTSMLPGNPRLTVSEKMMWSTYPLATKAGMATGFVVAKRAPKAPGGFIPIVVTSHHVIDTIGKGPLYIAARVPNGKEDPSVVTVELSESNQNLPYYVKHPKHDIAAFELNMPPKVASRVALASFVSESELTGEPPEAHAGEEIAFLGYPEVLPGTPGAFPVLRSGRIASYSSGMLRTQHKFLINADAYPGDSGAPVFIIRRNGTPQLLGMVVQRVGPDRKNFVPLALAVDARAIRETLQLLSARERRLSKASKGNSRTAQPARGTPTREALPR